MKSLYTLSSLVYSKKDCKSVLDFFFPFCRVESIGKAGDYIYINGCFIDDEKMKVNIIIGDKGDVYAERNYIDGEYIESYGTAPNARNPFKIVKFFQSLGYLNL